ncbi:DUF805 domain-containing protein [Pleionea sp. CnH1-48]|uniref:DUF805 domain-containing protein n=1 Tax=Pleionea sp. CnH1-48 TaxID=2954494 RepID=UPI002096A8CD|nr:DUF805 domain-containing protein [Pleionea sp. CnH1-48]MCO7223958.1 DUF805 domain-containing protein [Pleionea sp. CnH1-48]
MKVVKPNRVSENTINMQQFIVNQASFFSMNRIGRMRFLVFSYGVPSLLFAGFMSLLVTSGESLKQVPEILFIGSIGLLFFTNIFFVALSFVMMIRRLNDLGKTGWISLLYFVPVLNVLLILYLVFFSGDSEVNQYGNKPVPNTLLITILGLLTPVLAVVGVVEMLMVPSYLHY